MNKIILFAVWIICKGLDILSKPWIKLYEKKGLANLSQEELDRFKIGGTN